MKKEMLIYVLCVVLISFSLAVEDYSQNSDVQDITELVYNLNNVVDVESGTINPNAIDFGKTAAEERIDNVNKWLNENVSWLRFVFRMTPQISLLFFLDFLFILWGIVYLIFRAGDYWDTENKIYNYLIGTSVFFILFLLNVPYYFSKFGLYLIEFIAQRFAKTVLISSIIVIGIFIAVGFFFPQFIISFAKLFTKSIISSCFLKSI